MRALASLTTAAALCAIGAVPSASALPRLDDVHFSIDAASPTVPTVSQSDVLVPGPVGGPPAVEISATELGLPAGTTDEVDALTGDFFPDEGIDGFPFGFSVDSATVGAPGTTVASEAALGQAAGDMFISPQNAAGIGNDIFFNQDSFGLVPAVAFGMPASGPIDDVDAFAVGVTAFSLAAGNGLGVSGADLLAPGLTTVLSATDLGLVFEDDVDAVQAGANVFEPSELGYYFSLAPGSPSLSGGFSPADLFFSIGDGSFFRYTTAAQFGLLATDNINALLVLPEPGSGALFGLGLAALWADRARRRKRRAA